MHSREHNYQRNGNNTNNTRQNGGRRYFPGLPGSPVGAADVAVRHVDLGVIRPGHRPHAQWPEAEDSGAQGQPQGELELTHSRHGSVQDGGEGSPSGGCVSGVRGVGGVWRGRRPTARGAGVEGGALLGHVRDVHADGPVRLRWGIRALVCGRGRMFFF